MSAEARTDNSALAELTERERAVLAEIATGKSNLAIAQELQLSQRAVEKHTHAIFVKLGLSNAKEMSKRVKAALLFLAEGQMGAKSLTRGCAMGRLSLREWRSALSWQRTTCSCARVFCQLLAGSPSVEVVGAYGDVDALLGAVEQDRPDVVLTDIRMPPSNSDEGIRVAERLRQTARRPE